MISPSKENEFVSIITNLEKKNTKEILGKNLQGIYKEVQSNCSDFRDNIFNKNLSLLDDTLFYSWKDSENEEDRDYDAYHKKLLKKCTPYQELIKMYAERAKQAL